MKQIFDNKVFMYYCLHPSEERGIRELAKAMKISHTQVGRLVKPLTQQSVLVGKQVGRSKVIAANKANDDFFLYKKWNNLRLLLESGILELLKHHPVQSAILFGSFSKGYDDEHSDIDIAVSESIEVKSDGIEKYMQRKISFHVIKDMKASTLENIRQGVLLWGVMP